MRKRLKGEEGNGKEVRGVKQLTGVSYRFPLPTLLFPSPFMLFAGFDFLWISLRFRAKLRRDSLLVDRAAASLFVTNDADRDEAL